MFQREKCHPLLLMNRTSGKNVYVVLQISQHSAKPQLCKKREIAKQLSVFDLTVLQIYCV